MKNQEKAKIFLAEERGVSETQQFSSLYTFNFGKFFHEYKQPFGSIYHVNDNSLDAGCSLDVDIEKYSYLILLPVMGAIAVKNATGYKSLLAAGQLQIITCDKDGSITINNPFKGGIVNFLQIGIRAVEVVTTRANSISDYNINMYPNELIKISPDKLSLPFIISIGKFNGREEAIQQLKNKNAGAFAFVIEGAFEIQGRLLHAGDALALWNISEIEIEAFSNEAILLLIEQFLEG